MGKRILASVLAMAAITLLVVVFVKANRASVSPPPPISTPPAHESGQTYGVGWSIPSVPMGGDTDVPYGRLVQTGTPYFGNPVTDPNYSGQYWFIVWADTFSASISAKNGTPPAGEHYAAVHFKLENYAPQTTSTTVYVVAGARVITTDGLTYPAVTGVDMGSSHPLISPGAEKLKGGQTLSGWLVFLVPGNKSIKKIRVAPQGIYAGQADWVICDIAHPQGCS
jgi:hypothetical protein